VTMPRPTSPRKALREVFGFLLWFTGLRPRGNRSSPR
jgi:hypothetical protein